MDKTNFFENNFQLLSPLLDEKTRNKLLKGKDNTSVNSGNINVANESTVLSKDDKIICPSWEEFCGSAIKKFNEEPQTVRIERPIADREYNYQHKQLLSDIIGSELPHSLDFLESLKQSNSNQNKSEQIKDILVLGSLNLKPCIEAYIKESLDINSIVLCESNIKDLAILMQIYDLHEMVSILKRNNVGLSILINEDVGLLKHEYLNLVGSKYTPALNGLAICTSLLSDPSLLIFEAWMTDPDGFNSYVLGFLGNDTDEINQLCHAVWNTLGRNSNQKLLAPIGKTKGETAVICSSGPSLAQSYDWLKTNRSNLTIFAAGSSIGSLLANGIEPDYSVLLEMSHIVYEDLMKHADGQPIYKNITLISPLTIDPRISDLFKNHIIFHRPLSSTIALFPSEISSGLIQSGPQVANAAFEVVAKIGFSNAIILGVDFSGPNPNEPRASNALGSSIRTLDMPVAGRSGKTVYTSVDLSVAAEMFQAAIDYYPECKLYSPPNGISLKNITVKELQDLPTHLLQKPQTLYLDVDLSKRHNYTDDEIISILENIIQNMVDYEKDLQELIKNETQWTTSLTKGFSKFLNHGRSEEKSEFVFVKRMTRFALFFIVQFLHDSNPNKWGASKEVASKDILEYFAFQRNLLETIIDKVKNNQSWSQELIRS